MIHVAGQSSMEYDMRKAMYFGQIRLLILELLALERKKCCGHDRPVCLIGSSSYL